MVLPSAPAGHARERILTAAYQLFVERGVRAVGVNEIISVAGVAKATFYNHFPAKDDLVVAFFERRRELFTIGHLGAESERRGCDTPQEQLLVMFEIFDEWFQTPDFTGCPYIRTLIEAGPNHPVGAASLTYLEEIRSRVEHVAAAMGLTDPVDFAYSWMVLMQGAIVSAVGIDPKSANRIRKLGEQLIILHTPTHATAAGLTASPR